MHCPILPFPVGTRALGTMASADFSRQALLRHGTSNEYIFTHASVRPPRIRTLSFHLIPTPFTPTVPNSYGTLICLAISSTVKCLIWSFYSLGQMFAAASFRFHLAMDTLALGYSLPAIRVASGLAPVRQCSCRAYQEGWCVTSNDTPSY